MFQKQLHATFTVKLGRRAMGVRSVTQLTVLDTVDDLLRYELFLLVTQGRRYKFCKNCGKPFIPSGRSDAVYCDRVMDGAEKPCSVIEANITMKKKVDGDPVLLMYRRAYQRMRKAAEAGRRGDYISAMLATIIPNWRAVSGVPGVGCRDRQRPNRILDRAIFQKRKTALASVSDSIRHSGDSRTGRGRHRQYI